MALTDLQIKRAKGKGKHDRMSDGSGLFVTGQIFRYSIAHGLSRRNPTSVIRPADILKTTHKINYARIDAKDLPELLQKIEVYPGTHVTRFAIKLMALTFVRTGELINARWSEIDVEAARWNIPAERMKMNAAYCATCPTVP
jgi:integrase